MAVAVRITINGENPHRASRDTYGTHFEFIHLQERVRCQTRSHSDMDMESVRAETPQHDDGTQSIGSLFNIVCMCVFVFVCAFYWI